MNFRLPYEPALDGLRAPAVLAVMVFHAMPSWLPGGFLGVDVFFVLSGYLITSLLLVEFELTHRLDLAKFFIRRWFRLAPAMLLMLLVYGAIVGLFASSATWRNQGVDIILTATYLSNWARALALKDLTDLGHTWSLSVEGQFYLFWPILLWAMLRLARQRKMILLVVVVLGCVSFAVRQWLLLHEATIPRVYNGLDTRVETLLWGAALAVYLRWQKPPWVHCGVMAWCCVAGISSLFVAAQWTSPLYYQAGISLASALSTGLIAFLSASRSGVLANILSNRWAVWVGKVSYGLYLWHFPIYRMLLSFDLDGGLLLLVGLSMTVPVAAMSYHFLERPLLNWSKTR